MILQETKIPIATKTPVELRIEAHKICDEIDNMMNEDSNLWWIKMKHIVSQTSEKTAELLSA